MREGLFTHTSFYPRSVCFGQGYFAPGKAYNCNRTCAFWKFNMASSLLIFVTSLLSKTNDAEEKRRQPEMKKQKSEDLKRKERFMRYRDRRRKKLLLLMHMMSTLINPPRERNVWMNHQSDDWFRLADSTFTQEQWYENFHVTKSTFTFILGKIEHEIERQDTPMRKPVPARKKLAMIHYYLASTSEYRTIANLFGVSKTFLSNSIKDVSCAII